MLSRLCKRRQLLSVVHRLDLPEEWSIPEFVAAVEVARGRRITLLPLPEGAPIGLCGLWLARDDDIVFCRQSASVEQSRHTLVHEAAHMLLGHSEEVTDAAGLSAALTGVDIAAHGIDASQIRAAKGGPSKYDCSNEWDAEMLATMIMTSARGDDERRRERMLRAF